jgi:hypothetical protein
MAFLYIPIFPFGIVISFFGFCLGYLLEKLNFCIMYKKPEVLGAKICKFYVDYFIIVIFIYALGDYFFLLDAYDTKIWTYINLSTFGILIFVPYIRIISHDYLKLNKSELFKKEYKDCLDFNTDYERSNPISIKEGKLNYLKRLKDRNIITEKQLIEYVKDIYHINIMQIYYFNKDRKNDKENNSDKDKVIKFSNEITLQNNANPTRNLNFGNNNNDNNNIQASKLSISQMNSNNNIIINNNNNLVDSNNQNIL